MLLKSSLFALDLVEVYESTMTSVTPFATPLCHAGTWLRWRHEAKQNKMALQAQKAVEMEVGVWEPMGADGSMELAPELSLGCHTCLQGSSTNDITWFVLFLRVRTKRFDQHLKHLKCV